MSQFSFGEKVSGLNIPVLNEREIRAAAGLLFLFVFIGVQQIIYTWNFTVLKFAITFFALDFYIRFFLSPRFSPSLILGRWLVRKQTPEYVGAEQKKFAWLIGVTLGTVMLISLCVLNIHSPITGIICLICQVFLFFEAAFGICLGCIAFPYIYGRKPQHCPGEVCEVKDRSPIQLISKTQWLIVLFTVLAFSALVPALKETYAKEPTLILGMEKPK